MNNVKFYLKVLKLWYVQYVAMRGIVKVKRLLLLTCRRYIYGIQHICTVFTVELFLIYRRKNHI